eukprot:175596-Pleurochrysis_carterae.AAC.1
MRDLRLDVGHEERSAKELPGLTFERESSGLVPITECFSDPDRRLRQDPAHRTAKTRLRPRREARRMTCGHHRKAMRTRRARLIRSRNKGRRRRLATRPE